jgi:hypothetical protein
MCVPFIDPVEVNVILFPTFKSPPVTDKFPEGIKTS